MIGSGGNRVVVTGIGCVSAFGIGRQPFWEGLSTGRSAIAPVRRACAGMEITLPAAAVPGYQAKDHFAGPDLLLLDPFTQYALLAAREAASEAGIGGGSVASDRIAVVLGTGTAGEATREEASVRLYGERRERTFPMMVPKLNAQAAASWVSRDLGAAGPLLTISTGCAAATHAVGMAMMLLRQGLADCVITGGSEAGIVYGTLKAFDGLRVLAPDTCRPFSHGRAGFVMGEGAGIVVLETTAGARRRGAAVLGSVLGFGMTADAGDAVHPTVDGPARAMALALADAGLAPEQVGHINAHGTGTLVNDRAETQAIRQVFGAHADRLAVSATKSMHGHALGATGGLELAATLMALAEGVLPPTANYLGADDGCDLDYVTGGPRRTTARAALSNSFAFGGLNAVLAIARDP
jgi:nodulation protein E